MYCVHLLPFMNWLSRNLQIVLTFSCLLWGPRKISSGWGGEGQVGVVILKPGFTRGFRPVFYDFYNDFVMKIIQHLRFN